MKKKRIVALLTGVFIMISTTSVFAKPLGIYLKSKDNPEEVIYISYNDYIKAHASRNQAFKEVLDKYDVAGISVNNGKNKKVIDYSEYEKGYKSGEVKNMDSYVEKSDSIKYKNPDKVKELSKDGNISKEEKEAPDKKEEDGQKDYIDIAEARNRQNGESVTIKGVVTGTLGNNAFIQDDTAGLYIFVENNTNENLKVGNLVKVSGILDEYNNLKQISHKKGSVNVEKLNEVTLPEAKLITADKVGEELEGQLVTLKALTLSSEPTGISGYSINAKDDNGNSVIIRVDKNIKLDSNLFKGVSKIDVTAIIGQFKEEYQLMVKGVEDFKFLKDDGSEFKNEIVEFKKISLVKGSKLPEKINAIMTNGTLKEFQVKWPENIDVNTVGSKTVNVEVEGKSYAVNIEIIEASEPGDNTLPADLEKYYEKAAGKMGPELKQSLHDTIKGHTKLSYSQVWGGIQDTDEDPNNNNNVILLYSGVSSPKSNKGGEVTQWNREHVWAKSRGQFGTSNGAGTDLHHLRATNVKVNSLRGHLDFDNGGSPVSGAPDCKKTDTTWEPRDEVKGDVARMLFYMAVRYEGDAQGEPDLEIVDKITPDNKKGEIGKLSTLLQWHKQDPVDATEIRRNNIIYEKYQHNRNPFIDNPSWVDSIWGQANPANPKSVPGLHEYIYRDLWKGNF